MDVKTMFCAYWESVDLWIDVSRVPKNVYEREGITPQKCAKESKVSRCQTFVIHVFFLKKFVFLCHIPIIDVDIFT